MKAFSLHFYRLNLCFFFSCLRWSLWGEPVKVEGGCMLSVSFNVNFTPYGDLLMSTFVLTRLPDLHKVLANLARATVESIVQER